MKGLMYIFFHITKVQAPFTLGKKKIIIRNRKMKKLLTGIKRKEQERRGKKLKTS